MPNNIDITSNGDVVALANSLGGFSGESPDGPGHNDAYDAFKHAYGSAKLAEAFGDDFSKFWMDYREGGTPPAEQNMDKWNNNVGREEYDNWKEAKDAETPEEPVGSLEEWIYDAVKAGKTINDLNDPRIWKEPPSTWDKIKDAVNDFFSDAQRFVPRRDPLTLDLDGDGLETVPPSSTDPILFDHEGDGVKSGTGWVSADDGFLVLDRDGNGTIDSGRELFGDSTPLFDAEGNEIGKAEDGFAALAQEDTNADGTVDAQDARWTDLRVWQDLNQDGVSQADELKTLDELGIAGITVAKTEYSQVLPGGNEIADLGTFIRTDGSTGSMGTTSTLADVNLAADTFHRSFDDTIPTTAETEDLPDMQGSGMVPDLREAANDKLWRVAA